jgi:AraC family transcriptional regulator, transcriptional activator FtrA
VGTHRVATIVAAGANPFEFAVASEVFGLARPELGPPLYDHRLAVTSHPVVVNGGWQVDSPHGLEAVAWADTVIVPAAAEEVACAVPRAVGGEARAVRDAIRAAHRRGARIVSFCSGVFALAGAGILDGRPAATHWLYVDELRRRYPTIRIDGDVLYVDDGQVLTSAGTAAAIDLALHIVRLDHGARMANEVARRMVIPPHRDGGQAQFATTPVPVTVDDDRLGPVLEWMVEHLDEQLTVPQLARLAAMSPRSFARHFREQTGTTPLRWLQHQRIARAQELLEASDLSIEAIAHRVGLGTAANLRLHFRRATSTTPAAYRQRFRVTAA